MHIKYGKHVRIYDMYRYTQYDLVQTIIRTYMWVPLHPDGMFVMFPGEKSVRGLAGNHYQTPI